MGTREAWAGGATVLPTEERLERERPFWAGLAAAEGWQVVVDAGCGAGFHLALLGGLGVATWGFDLAVTALAAGPRRGVAAGDVGRPPLRPGCADAVLCLGNTFSLLPARSAQRQALAALAALLRPGGALLLQGEDAVALTAAGAVLRTRPLADGRVHVRAFERRGSRVRMIAGAVKPGGEAPAHGVWMLGTSPASLAALAGPLALRPSPLPVAPPGGGATWWLLLRRDGQHSGT